MQDAHAGAALRVDHANACLWRGAEAIRLTPKALAVLGAMVAQAGRLVTKETLLQAVWPEAVVSEAALTVCIREIRQALGDAARTPQYIETVHRRGYRCIGPLEGQVGGPPQALHARGAGPPGAPSAALGRAAELRQLHGWLAQVQRGERCVGFVTGEAGMGKTTLVDTFLEQAAAAGGLWLARGQCVEHYGAGEAYLPVLEALGHLCRGPEQTRVRALLGQHAPLWLLQMPALLSPAALEALQRQVRGATPDRMLREFAEAMAAVTAERPLVLVLEDLHWSDSATLDLVAYLAQRREPARATASADWPAGGGWLWGAGRRARGGAGPSLRAWARPGTGRAVSAAGGGVSPGAVCLSGGHRPPQPGAGAAPAATRDAGASAARARPAACPGAGVDGHQGHGGPGGGAGLRPGAGLVRAGGRDAPALSDAVGVMSGRLRPGGIIDRAGAGGTAMATGAGGCRTHTPSDGPRSAREYLVLPGRLRGGLDPP